MKANVTLFFIFGYLFSGLAQVDRYPNIQSAVDTGVIIAWRGAASAIGSVNWGTSAGALTNVITESASSQIHAINIPGLQPNTKYYYQAKSGAFQSSVEYFYTAKPDSVRQLDFLAYGDCGFNNSVQNTIGALMAAQTVDLAVVAGDIDQNVGDDYDTRFFQRYKDMLKHTCHFTAIGNHDVITNNTNYTDAFHLLHNNPANSEKYYSFTWGNAKFITIDGNSNYTVGSAQYVWLQNELKCNDREWTFVYFHQPPWTNGWDVSYNIPFTPFYQYQGNVDMRTSIVPLFEQYKVDVVLNGHTHNYERGIYNGVRYFITGGAGGATPDTHQSSNAPNIQMEQNINNYMKWSINGDTARYYTYNLSGAKVDSQIIIKTFTPYKSTLTTVDVVCNGSSNGSATINVVGPHTPYSFSWSSGSSTNTASALAAGTYTVTISDVNGCTKKATATIQQTNPIVLQAVKTNETCPNTKDGKVTLTATGGTSPYNFVWGNGVKPDSLTAGVYVVTVTDANQCSSIQSDTIKTLGGKKPLLTTLNNNTLICKGDSLRVNAPSGYASYSWNVGGTSSTVSTKTGGLFYTLAIDSFGCTVHSDSLLLTFDSVPHLQIAATTSNNLVAHLDASRPGLSNYYWDFGNGQKFTGINAHTDYVYADSGTYTVQLVTKYACGNDTTTTIVHVGKTVSGIIYLKGNELKVSIQPNPFSEETNVLIDPSAGDNFQSKLFSLDGKLVRDLGNTMGNNITIKRELLVPGVYLLFITNGSSNAAFKLMVE